MPSVQVGVGIFLQRPDGAFVVGVRKSSHGSGTIQLAGGHLEFGESFEACGAREVLEETGLRVAPSALRFLTATNTPMEAEGKHYVTTFLLAQVSQDAMPIVTEPDKCEKWEWISWERLGELARATEGPKLFAPLRDLLVQRPDISLAPKLVR